jgi:hypothetical protein
MTTPAQRFDTMETQLNTLAALVEDIDRGDPYGTAMSWWFATCDVLHFNTDTPVPPSWDYSPSPVGADTECFEYELLSYMTGDELLAVGEACSALYDTCVRDSLDY